MKRLSAKNELDLLARLKSVNISVPPIDAGRTTEHSERWSICRLLATLASHGLLEFQLLLTKTERPDFILKMGEKQIGVEFTEGIQPDYARARVLPEANRHNSILDPSLFKWGVHRRTLSELRSIASQKKLTGPGWEGVEIEVEWAQAIHDITEKKTQKLQSPGFKVFPENWLLIYDNLNSFALDLDESLLMLLRDMKDYWTPDGFTCIFVESGDKIVKIEKDAFRKLPLHNIWKN